jgi:hypothetical protein
VNRGYCTYCSKKREVTRRLAATQASGAERTQALRSPDRLTVWVVAGEVR